MVDLITLETALQETDGKDRNLLIGNGFSVAQTNGGLSYANLLEKSSLGTTDPIRNVFNRFDTVDFEVVMHALEHAAKVEDAYGDQAKKAQFERDADRVREALIHAVREVHPPIQFDVPAPQLKSCGDFLVKFENIFTLNYDLLIYWVNLNYTPRKHRDGFGLGEETGGFREFNESAHCSIYNLHGGLHLFKSPRGETLKRISTGNTILNDIESTIRSHKTLPLFVAEGTSQKKMAKINSVPYLKHSLDKLASQEAPIFIFGHSANDSDKHIYDAILSSGCSKIYFCVYDPSDNFVPIQRRLAPYMVGRSDLIIKYIDASRMNIWGI